MEFFITVLMVFLTFCAGVKAGESMEGDFWDKTGFVLFALLLTLVCVAFLAMVFRGIYNLV